MKVLPALGGIFLNAVSAFVKSIMGRRIMTRDKIRDNFDVIIHIQIEPSAVLNHMKSISYHFQAPTTLLQLKPRHRKGCVIQLLLV